MTIGIAPDDAGGGGTELVAMYDGIPSGISTADNETDWREALARLTALASRLTRPRSQHRIATG